MSYTKNLDYTIIYAVPCALVSMLTNIGPVLTVMLTTKPLCC